MVEGTLPIPQRQTASQITDLILCHSCTVSEQPFSRLRETVRSARSAVKPEDNIPTRKARCTQPFSRLREKMSRSDR
jgi:hypothetical protein